MRLFILLLLLLSQHFVYSQSISDRLQTHQTAFHLEKIYISHNQPFYAPGDTLFGKIFLVNGRTHQYFEGTPIVYVDLMSESGTIFQSYIVKMQDGTADLSIPFARDFSEGRYHLRAYTQYQKNFDEHYIFQKAIKIIGEEPLKKQQLIGDQTNFQVRFFPEGGHLVAGLKSAMAFEATNGRGEPIDVTGQIVDNQGNPIAQFKSYNEGIGVINIQPQMGVTYQAEVNWNGLVRSFELPKLLKEGYVLKAIARKEETITLQLSANAQKNLAGCTLIGHLRGQIFLTQALEQSTTQKLLLDRTQIPSGVLHFTLFDAEERPVCERLVFNNNPSEAVSINIDMPKTDYGVKELVTATVSGKVANTDTEGDLTIAVYNKDVFANEMAGSNIKNYLLLQSDLRGRINNINQYFEKEDAKSRTLLDYLMLTQGWRRFNWQDVLEAKPTPISFPTEESISFAGSVKKNNNRANPVKADVFLNILDGKNFASVNLTTEDDGLFYFKGFDLPDSTEILIQGNVHNPKKKAKKKEGSAGRTGNKNVQIELLSLHDLPFNDSVSLKSSPYNKAAQTIFAKEINRIRKVDTIYHPEWTIDLDAVTVKAQRLAESRKKEAALKKKYKDRGLFYSASSDKIYMDDLVAGGATYLDIYDIIRDRIPSARIVGNGQDRQVLIRGESSFNVPTYAIIELDGVIISGSTAASIVPSNVDMLDVKKGLAATAIYGEAGKGGVISILTREPGDLKRNVNVPGIITIQHPGYHQARTFYIPDYEAGADREKPDFRTCLYWNGNLKLRKNPSSFQFYTGDKLSTFLIFVEGITKNGIPFIAQQEIQIGK